MRWFFCIEENWLVREDDGNLYDPDTDKEVTSITVEMMATGGLTWHEFDNDPRGFGVETLKQVGKLVGV
jgi:hypothetical protein